MDNIEILRRNGRAMQHGCGSAHDDEFHSIGAQLGQQGFWISDSGALHARNLLAKRAIATPARSLSPTVPEI